MLEAYDSNKWCTFYPLISNPLDEIIDNRSLEELPDKIYGKILSGFVGFQPWWTYTTVEKKNVRIKDNKKNK
jgi:hypothetical protein